MALNSAAWSQSYPGRPVSVVIPFAAGGTTDGEVRLYTDKLLASLGQPFVMDFRGGVGGSIGLAYVLKAAPDGYTLMVSNSGMAIFPNFYPQLNHSVVSQLIPVIELSNRATGVITSPAGLPNVYSLKELIAYGKANPGKLACNTAGAGGASHINCAALANVTGVPILPVHYKGVAQGQIDLIAGRTHVSVGTLFNAMTQVKAGKLRIIATMGEHRSSLLPDLATTHELGYNVDYPNWLGAFVPPRTPQPIVDKLNAEFGKAVKAPDVAALLEKSGAAPVGGSEASFRKRFANDLVYWKKIVEANNITASDMN